MEQNKNLHIYKEALINEMNRIIHVKKEHVRLTHELQALTESYMRKSKEMQDRLTKMQASMLNGRTYITQTSEMLMRIDDSEETAEFMKNYHEKWQSLKD